MILRSATVSRVLWHGFSPVPEHTYTNADEIRTQHAPDAVVPTNGFRDLTHKTEVVVSTIKTIHTQLSRRLTETDTSTSIVIVNVSF